jgi:hypothetical protein
MIHCSVRCRSWVSVVAFDPITTTYGDSDITEDCSSAAETSCCVHCVKCQQNDCQSSGVFSCDSVGTGSTLTQNSSCLACQQTNSGKPQSLVNMVNNNSSSPPINVTNTTSSSNISQHTCVPNFPRSSRQSRTSESMRLSLSEPASTRIPACYRVGSVGQDTQICLWDLTEDVLKQPFGKSRPPCRSSGRNGNLSDTSPCAIHSNSKPCKSHLHHHHNNLPNCNSSSTTNCATTAACKSHSDKEESSSSVVGNNVHSGTQSSSTVNLNISSPTSTAVNTSTNGTSSSQPLSNSSGHSHGILSLRFGALSFGVGDKDKNKDGKEHKRNFSLGSSSNKSDKNSGGSNSKSTVGPASGLAALGLNIDKLDDPLKLIGTQACPRLDECPLLEPLICKKISHERLTTLIFRDESIVTACQDGIVCTWARPGDAVSQL